LAKGRGETNGMGLPDTKVGTFTQALYDEAKKDGWTEYEGRLEEDLAFEPGKAFNRRKRREQRK
jgi:hypothetical protein